MLSIILGSTLYSTTLLIASTLLPQMQGAMAATQDEIAWAMTFNILATAVVTPMTGWLVARFGRRDVDGLARCCCFSLFTYLCGAADSLETLVLWRILQGALGAPVIAAVADHPVRRLPAPAAPHDHLGLRHGGGDRPGDRPGARRLSVRYVQLALGLLHAGAGRARCPCIGLRLSMLPDPPRGRVRLDWIGFLSLSAAISCVQLVLSRGQRLDWFEFAGDLVGDRRRGSRLLHLRRAQPDRASGRS